MLGPVWRPARNCEDVVPPEASEPDEELTSASPVQRRPIFAAPSLERRLLRLASLTSSSSRAQSAWRR
eukprot:482953-Alexandrium_andersonii.AAC.1